MSQRQHQYISNIYQHHIYIKVAISIFQCLTCVVSSSRSSFIRVKDTIFKDCYQHYSEITAGYGLDLMFLHLLHLIGFFCSETKFSSSILSIYQLILIRTDIFPPLQTLSIQYKKNLFLSKQLKPQLTYKTFP